MRAGTQIHIAIRNIGDSTDHGKFYYGTVRDSLFWLVEQIGSLSMAERIVVGIGRDKPGAEKALTSGRSSGGVLDDGMRSMLDSFFDGAEGVEEAMTPTADVLSSIDDYQP